MTITRDSTGKQLYKDFSEYADQAAYEGHFNSDQYGLTLDAANNYIYDTHDSSQNFGGIYNVATYQNLYLRSRAKATGGVGDWLAIGLRRKLSSGIWTTSNDMYFVLLSYTGNMQMIKVVSGSVSAIVGDTASGFNPSSGAEFDLVFTANGTALEALINGTSKMSTTDSGVSAAGYVELFKSNNIQCYFTDLCVCTSPDLTCSDLPTGYKFRVTDRDGTTAVATESSGTATVAGKTLMYPGDKVEVLNAADGVVETYNLADDVWGGDAYAYSASAASSRRFVQLI